MNKGEEKKLKATSDALKELDAEDFKWHKMNLESVVKELKSNIE